MPKLIPVPDALSKPFWDAVNQRRLVLQHCAACDRLQYPPQQACQVCNSAAGLTWKEVEGRGHIASYIVIEDGRLNRRMPDQPYNMAMVTLDADPRVNFYSNLPGTPPYKVPVGAAVEVTFEEVAPDQLIHEWRVVGLERRRGDAAWTRYHRRLPVRQRPNCGVGTPIPGRPLSLSRLPQASWRAVSCFRGVPSAMR